MLKMVAVRGSVSSAFSPFLPFLRAIPNNFVLYFTGFNIHDKEGSVCSRWLG
jgi:hypothetical protein